MTHQETAAFLSDMAREIRVGTNGIFLDYEQDRLFASMCARYARHFERKAADDARAKPAGKPAKVQSCG